MTVATLKHVRDFIVLIASGERIKAHGATQYTTGIAGRLIYRLLVAMRRDRASISVIVDVVDGSASFMDVWGVWLCCCDFGRHNSDGHMMGTKKMMSIGWMFCENEGAEILLQLYYWSFILQYESVDGRRIDADNTVYGKK
jgi:hypothetical protein